MRTQLLALVVVLVCHVAVSLAWGQGQPGGERLSAQQWLEAMNGSGIMLDGRSDRGHTFSMLLVLSDEAKGVALDLWTDRFAQEYAQNQGSWRMDGDALCVTWPTANRNQERCGHVYRLADGNYQAWGSGDGKLMWTGRLRLLQ